MTVRVKKRSWLRFGELAKIDGIEFWDIVDLPTIPEQPDDIQHVVEAHDRFDLLANRYYGDPVTKWVILVANGLELEPSDLNEGDVLRIPAPRYVLNQLYSDTSGVNG